MAFDPIIPAEIEAGEPNKQELWLKTKDNQIDLDSRITAIEGIGFMPIHFFLSGPISLFNLRTKIDIQRITFDINLLAGRILVSTAGASGNTEIDILFKRGVAAWTSIFSTKPTLAFGAGDDAIGTGVLTVTSLLAGDLIRMDQTAVQTGGKDIIGILEFEEG